MSTDTTIALSSKTKKRLESLRIIPQDTMDNIINRLLDDYNKKIKQKKITD